MQSLEFEISGISINGTVIDIETTELEAEKGRIITFGYLSRDRICVFQVETQNECNLLGQTISALYSSLPRPHYAYNKGFEERWLAKLFSMDIHIDEDLMDPWRLIANWAGQKFPKLRELVRPPIFYFRHWGIADLDREDSPMKLFSDMDSITTVNQIISRETAINGPHILWQEHLKDMADPEVQREIALHSERPQEPLRRPIHRLPNGNWVSTPLAAIICHNVIDLISEASLLLWRPMVGWIQ